MPVEIKDRSIACSGVSSPPSRRVWRPWAAALFLLFTTACASTRTPPAERPVRRGDAPPTAAVAAGTESGPDASLRADEIRLREAVQRWEGTPFAFGGEDRRGLDCSAFVQHVYGDAFGVRLPRTTEDQVRLGDPVATEDLRAGDLVFFRPPKTRHVGVYLGKGEFAHVSTHRGVTISRLDERYWQDTYWTSRRLVAAPPEPVAAPGAPARAQPAPRGAAPGRAAPAAAPASGRRGW